MRELNGYNINMHGGASPKYHNMYKNNNMIVAKTEDEHNVLEKLGYNHSPPQKGGAIPKNTELYDKIKKEMDIIYKKSSAFKSGAIQKRYQCLGGEYIEDNKPKILINGLRKMDYYCR